MLGVDQGRESEEDIPDDKEGFMTAVAEMMDEARASVVAMDGGSNKESAYGKRRSRDDCH